MTLVGSASAVISKSSAVKMIERLERTRGELVGLHRFGSRQHFYVIVVTLLARDLVTLLKMSVVTMGD